ncbi:hypothetical protein [Tabrizicola sp.]|uniref:hypothetical protein n=1 Tax=Tabrizicola sp. TaxID=2005166 RepID=UPI003F32EE99
MLQRISAAIAAGRRSVALASDKTRQDPHRASSVHPSWALICFGEPERVTARLVAHLARCRARQLRCLFLSDDIPQMCVVSRDIVFEFLPWPASTALSTPGGFAGAVDHSFRRLSLTMTFWQVIGADWEGDRARELLDLAPGWAHPVVRAARAVTATPSQIL